jgi:hypothetical protein
MVKMVLRVAGVPTELILTARSDQLSRPTKLVNPCFFEPPAVLRFMLQYRLVPPAAKEERAELDI